MVLYDDQLVDDKDVSPSDGVSLNDNQATKYVL